MTFEIIEIKEIIVIVDQGVITRRKAIEEPHHWLNFN